MEKDHGRFLSFRAIGKPYLPYFLGYLFFLGAQTNSCMDYMDVACCVCWFGCDYRTGVAFFTDNRGQSFGKILAPIVMNKKWSLSGVLWMIQRIWIFGWALGTRKAILDFSMDLYGGLMYVWTMCGCDTTCL